MNANAIALLKNNMEIQNTLLKAAGVGMVAQTLNGPGGLFNTPGLDNMVLNTVVKTRGLASALPAFPTLDTNPKFGIIGGISDDVGIEPINVCDDAPTGTMLVGTLTAAFGRVTRDTETIDIGAVNLRLNRGDFSDLTMIGSVLNPDNSGQLYPANLNGQQDLISTITNNQMVQTGTRLDRKLSTMLWYGDPANNTAQNGYMEFPGLATQLVTGQIDADDGTTALPTVDPLVIDAAWADLAAYDIVGEISDAEAYIHDLAEDTLGGMTGVFVMNSNFWRQLSETWPCQYNTGACAASLDGTEAGRVVLAGTENIAMRDQMRANMVLEVNGRAYPVIVDNGIHLVDSVEDVTNVPAGSYASSIFFIPLTFNGSTPATFWQHVDFRAATGDIANLNGRNDFWTDGGRFYWGYDSTGAFCYKLKLRTEPRVVCRTPQLAFRIDNLRVVTSRLFRAAIPTEPGYVAGGRAAGTIDGTHLAVWA